MPTFFSYKTTTVVVEIDDNQDIATPHSDRGIYILDDNKDNKDNFF